MALGSNFNAHKNIELAMTALNEAFPDIVFTEVLETEPIGIASDNFLNSMAKATTTASQEELRQTVKGIERMLGDERHDTDVVNMDIDILQYDAEKLRPKDWEREYIKALYEKLMTRI